MGPVDESALLVPDIFSGEAHSITDTKIADPRGNVRVVLNENGLPIRQPNYEALVRQAGVVIPEYAIYDPTATYLYVALV